MDVANDTEKKDVVVHAGDIMIHRVTKNAYLIGHIEGNFRSMISLDNGTIYRSYSDSEIQGFAKDGTYDLYSKKEYKIIFRKKGC